MLQSFIGWLKKLFKHKHRWGIIKTIWPYPDGEAVYCAKCGTILSIVPEEILNAQRNESRE